MPFTAVQRAGYLGASDMNYVMNDVAPAALIKWWEIKVGLRDPDPPTYAMLLGSAVGDLIVDEYERQCGEPIIRRQEMVPSPVNNRFRSTLDGFNVTQNAVIEAKFCGTWMSREQIFATYYPQVAMQMHCTNADRGYLVVGQGTSDPFEIECVRDPNYEQTLLEEAAAMLDCIDRLVPPVAIETPVAIAPEKWRTVDLEVDTPNWGDELIEYLNAYENTRIFADDHEAAGKMAKTLVPDDVGKVLTISHIIARNKKGALAITRRKS